MLLADLGTLIAYYGFELGDRYSLGTCSRCGHLGDGCVLDAGSLSNRSAEGVQLAERGSHEGYIDNETNQGCHHTHFATW